MCLNIVNKMVCYMSLERSSVRDSSSQYLTSKRVKIDVIELEQVVCSHGAEGRHFFSTPEPMCPLISCVLYMDGDEQVRKHQAPLLAPDRRGKLNSSLHVVMVTLKRFLFFYNLVQMSTFMIL